METTIALTPVEGRWQALVSWRGRSYLAVGASPLEALERTRAMVQEAQLVHAPHAAAILLDIDDVAESLRDPDGLRHQEARMITMTAKAKRLQAGHCTCNVTALVNELLKFDSEVAIDMMHGDPETENLAYPADQVWVVTDWLAGRLKAKGERVIRIENQSYWARRGDGPCIHLDAVILDIAKEQ